MDVTKSSRERHFYDFGPFRIDLTSRLLLRENQIVPVTPKVFDTLVVLVANAGSVVDKETLLATVWPGTFIEESSLAHNVCVLRKTLGKDADGRRWIETFPKRGYRFVGLVTTRSQVVADTVHHEAEQAESVLVPSEAVRVVDTVTGPWGIVPKVSPHVVVGVLIAGLAGLVMLTWHWIRQSGRETVALRNLVFRQLTDQPGMELYPSLSPEGNSFIYASNASGNWDIFLQRVGGRNPINLTSDSTADDTHPAFSRDGELIAFRSEREGGGIFVMGATGEYVRRVSDFGYNPAWSPNAKEIVCATAGFFRPDVRRGLGRVIAVDILTGQRRLLTERLSDAAQPNCSPHAYRIAVWGQMPAQGSRRDIWTVPASGGMPVRVTDDAYVDWNPVWSPDGKYLWFSSDRGGSMNLWRVPIDEKSGRVRGIPEPITTPSPYSTHLSFSRDGKRMVFVQQARTVNLYRVRFDDSREISLGQPSAITQGSREARHVDLSSDGRWLVYRQDDDLFLVGTDGKAPQKLTNGPYSERLPSWAPNQQKIAFCVNRTGKYEIWTIKPDGSGPRQITHDSRGPVLSPVWSPDGTRLAYMIQELGAFIMDTTKSWNGQLPEPLPPFHDPSLRFWTRSWSPDGRRLAGTLMDANESESGVAIYSLESRQYRQITPFGGQPIWLSDDRRLLFLHQGQIHLVDSQSGKTHVVLSVDPHEVDSRFVLSPDSFIYFGLSITEADIWLMSLQ